MRLYIYVCARVCQVKTIVFMHNIPHDGISAVVHLNANSRNN